ncbi:hypothetical protein [Aureimonas sp. AU40]|uniref:hypothetical protein n=1 Tax=Aureimonas sp. AU40 TaxID=1637747 RepID=UPI000782AEFE|nr:hypothetical protein [Aureimonas sp. AU40]
MADTPKMNIANFAADTLNDRVTVTVISEGSGGHNLAIYAPFAESAKGSVKEQVKASALAYLDQVRAVIAAA